MKRLSAKLTYSNVVSTLCLFLLVGGGTAFAATSLGKNSVGSKQLKKNAVTAAKLKSNAVTSAKIKNGAVSGAKIGAGAVSGGNIAAGTITGEKLAANSVTGDKINLATLGTVPSSATTSVVKTAKGTLTKGQVLPVFSYGPFTVTASCQEYEAGRIGEQFTISSTTEHSVFTSWWDGSSDLGPNTPANERELNYFDSAASSGPFEYEPPFDTGFSASAANGQGLNAFIGEATELDTNTCWYWLNANILG